MVKLCLLPVDNLLYNSRVLDQLYKNILSVFSKITSTKLVKLDSRTIKLAPPFGGNVEQYLERNRIAYEYFGEFYNARFCSRKIVETMIKEIDTITYYRFKYNSNIINLYAYGNSISLDSLLVKLTKCFILMEFVNIQNVEKDIYYYPSSFKKELRLGYELSPEHVNSGFTNFIGNIGSSIYIFREEDSDKVFLHECIHSLNLDFSTSYSSQLDKYILSNTLVDSNINLAESYTDLYAILINSLIDSCYTGVDYRQIIATEVLWQKKVVFHILKHMGISNIGELFIDKKHKPKKLFKQKTSVFSYYIIKLVLFSNLDYFIKTYPLGMSWGQENQWDYYEDILKNIDRVEDIPLKSFKNDRFSIRMVYNKLKINNC